MRSTQFAALLASLTLTCMLAVPAMAQDESPAADMSAAPAAAEPVAFDEAPYIPIVSKGFQHQFWQAVKKGAEDKGAETSTSRSTSSARRASPRSTSRSRCCRPSSTRTRPRSASRRWTARLPTRCWRRCQAKGIPVIAFDSGVDSDIPITTAATDNVAAAALAADKMAELIGGAGKVGVIVHDQTSRTGIDRRDGFVNRMTEAYPDIEIIDPQYGGGDQLKSTDLAKAIIQANPDIKGFFGANEGSAIGVVNAVNELGMAGKLVVIGYDSGKAQIDAIKSGLMAGAIQQNPVGIGAKCVAAAAMALQGMDVPPIIDTGFVWADATTIDSPEVAAVLYE